MVKNNVAKRRYDTEFHYSSSDASYTAAKEIVPWIMDELKPKSVVDFGCGLGTWLKCFKDYGVKEVFGIDGGMINKNNLFIAKKDYLERDLSKYVYNLKKRYDLAISLETGEHLPESSSDIYIKSLTTSSNTILFSAAQPKQGGILHINEQWPEYWQNKFNSHGYQMIDIRGLFLCNRKIAWWYRQNMFLFTKDKKLIKKFSKLQYTSEFRILHYSIFNRSTSPLKILKQKLYIFLQHNGLMR